MNIINDLTLSIAHINVAGGLFLRGPLVNILQGYIMCSATGIAIMEVEIVIKPCQIIANATFNGSVDVYITSSNIDIAVGLNAGASGAVHLVFGQAANIGQAIAVALDKVAIFNINFHCISINAAIIIHIALSAGNAYTAIGIINSSILANLQGWSCIISMIVTIQIIIGLKGIFYNHSRVSRRAQIMGIELGKGHALAAVLILLSNILLLKQYHAIKGNLGTIIGFNNGLGYLPIHQIAHIGGAVDGNIIDHDIIGRIIGNFYNGIIGSIQLTLAIKIIGLHRNIAQAGFDSIDGNGMGLQIADIICIGNEDTLTVFTIACGHQLSLHELDFRIISSAGSRVILVVGLHFLQFQQALQHIRASLAATINGIANANGMGHGGFPCTVIVNAIDAQPAITMNTGLHGAINLHITL